ncbi:MAG TPA: 6-phosphogluconolactonase [Bacteroidota bacterium]|nr:6-phosphogluconolactonase [Bacteroidota bacterium]
MNTFQSDRLKIRIYPDRGTLGAAAASVVGSKMRFLLSKQSAVRMVFAAAPSQNEFLSFLAEQHGIDWTRVTAFQMDEYLDLKGDAVQLFQHYLAERLFKRIALRVFHSIDPHPGKPEIECRRYSLLLQEAPLDIVCLGIGENGHIAFNDPHVADFDDPHLVKVVRLEERSRQQQVHDGCFHRLEDVPERAITLTIPALLSGRSLYCIVPGISKSEAVSMTVRGKIDVRCPASVLRRHADAFLFLDSDSSSRLVQFS